MLRWINVFNVNNTEQPVEGIELKKQATVATYGRGTIKMSAKHILAALVFIGGFAAGLAGAAEITIPEFSFTPDGSTTSTSEVTNVNVPNGGNILPTSPSVIFFVATYQIGTGSDAKLVAAASHTSDRLTRFGFSVNAATGRGQLEGVSYNTTVVIGDGDVSGEAIRVIVKGEYDTDAGFADGQPSRFTAWVNPTASSVEGSGWDLQKTWSSQNLAYFGHRIDNQSTPGTAGASSVSTVLLTGADATFENALDIALSVPIVTLSHNEVPTNAAPGTLVGSLTGPDGTDAFVLTNAPPSGSNADNAKFQITGTTNLSTAVWMSKQTNYVSIAALSNGVSLVTNSFDVIVMPATNLVFRVSAEVSRFADDGDVIGAMVVDQDDGASFSIVGGRSDLFTTDASDNLVVTNSTSWGLVGTTNFVTIRATSAAGSSDLTIGAVVINGIPDATVFRFM
jgi:hypothetical protein